MNFWFLQLISDQRPAMDDEEAFTRNVRNEHKSRPEAA